MIRRGAVALAALAATACNQRDAPPDPARTRAQAAAALTACLDAFAIPVDADRPLPAFPAACKPLVLDRRCRDAIEHLAPTSTDLRPLVAACGTAYCPSLPAPRPAACATLATGGGDPDADWGELFGAVLVHDLAIDDPALAARVRTLFAPVTVKVTRPAGAGAGATARPACDRAARATLATHFVVLEVLGEAPREIARCGRALDASALARTLCTIAQEPPCVPSLTITAAPSIPHGDVIALLDLAKHAGITRLALSVSPDLPPVSGTPDHVAARCDEPAPSSCP